jgi:hypothetical protein
VVVADGHPQPAPAADDDALQQRGAFAWWPAAAVTAVGGGVGGQAGEAGVVLLQGDVSGVGAGDEGDPLVAGQPQPADLLPALPGGKGLVAVPAIGEGPGVPGVVQHSQHGVAGRVAVCGGGARDGRGAGASGRAGRHRGGAGPQEAGQDRQGRTRG